ncbi:MAG: flavodoxin [Bacteroidales bacterium]|nr:flavodoxin [Bacteroidales bacterium]
MKKMAIFYGSDSGNTEAAAQAIAKAFTGMDVHLANIADTKDAQQLEGFDFIIMGTPTWGYGDLQEDWEQFIPKLKKISLEGKTVALFGLGDSGAYPDTFVDAMAELYEVVTQCGASVIGQVPVDNYDFDSSRAVMDGHFVGLALDEDNESDLTAKRISAWVEQLKPLL